MMKPIVSVDGIMKWFTEQVENKLPIDPHMWLEGAMKSSVLLQGEQEKLFELEQEVAKLKNLLLEDGKSVAFAKSKVEATEEYKKMKIQKAKIEGCLEFVRLAKLYSRTTSEIMRGSL